MYTNRVGLPSFLFVCEGMNHRFQLVHRAFVAAERARPQPAVHINNRGSAQAPRLVSYPPYRNGRRQTFQDGGILFGDGFGTRSHICHLKLPYDAGEMQERKRNKMQTDIASKQS